MQDANQFKVVPRTFDLSGVLDATEAPRQRPNQVTGNCLVLASVALHRPQTATRRKLGLDLIVTLYGCLRSGASCMAAGVGTSIEGSWNAN